MLILKIGRHCMHSAVVLSVRFWFSAGAKSVVLADSAGARIWHSITGCIQGLLSVTISTFNLYDSPVVVHHMYAETPSCQIRRCWICSTTRRACRIALGQRWRHTRPHPDCGTSIISRVGGACLLTSFRGHWILSWKMDSWSIRYSIGGNDASGILG